MIKKFTLVLIFFISALSSCKKTTETPAPNCLQTKVTVDNSSNSDVILYDSKNNVSKYIRTLSGSIITSEFTYNANGQVISAVYNDPDQNYIINYTFTYNSKGNMVKSVTIDNSSNTEYTTFEYTNNNKPLKETKSDGTYIRYEYDANGNNAIKEFKKDYSKEYLIKLSQDNSHNYDTELIKKMNADFLYQSPPVNCGIVLIKGDMFALSNTISQAITLESKTPGSFSEQTLLALIVKEFGEVWPEEEITTTIADILSPIFKISKYPPALKARHYVWNLKWLYWRDAITKL